MSPSSATGTSSLTADDLIAFEREIAELFNAGKIRAPVHLAGGNEQQLLEIFKKVRPDDWVCCQWRSHYHCLLKGVPANVLRNDIVAGKSIALCYPEYRIVSSAIAGGILPIATGLAWAAMLKREPETVWCFVGDMTARMGMFYECTQYALGHDLPIRFVIEDNGLSVCTPTNEAWGGDFQSGVGVHWPYQYTLGWPHAGAGKRVQF